MFRKWTIEEDKGRGGFKFPVLISFSYCTSSYALFRSLIVSAKILSFPYLFLDFLLAMMALMALLKKALQAKQQCPP